MDARPLARRTLDPSDGLWPPGLDDLGLAAPDVLRVRGTFPAPHELGIAIVGTRNPTLEGVELAGRWAHDLAAAGVVIWSGGALGIDSAAHEGALEAGGATVAVLGSGLDQSFPPENEDLFRRIVDGGRGAVMSCIADDVTADRPHFFHRNEVLAACTRVLLIVEAGIPSGTANAAAAARRLQRPVAVVPWRPVTGTSRGNAMELTEHRAWPVFTVEHVLSLAQRGTTATFREGRRRKGSEGESSSSSAVAGAAIEIVSRRSTAPEPTDPLEIAVLAELRRAPLHVDGLCTATCRSAPEIGRALFALAVEGLVQERTPGLWTSA